MNETKFPPNNHPVGETVIVKAWWTVPEGQLVKCKIETVVQPFKSGWTEYSGGYDVRPVANPGAHIRYIKPNAIVENVGN